ncbi:transferrin-binding protein-like solute binding protein [Haemophilus haemoglobinophilus]|nr:transferrin-binding protein-like solute binding protein [Canicola haemoglobinophilus]
MSIKKVTLASLILLSLTACSGGSGSSSVSNSNNTEVNITPLVQGAREDNEESRAKNPKPEEKTFEQKLKEANVPDTDIAKIRANNFTDEQRERFLSAAQRMKELDLNYDSKMAFDYSDNSLEKNHNRSLEEMLRSERANSLGVEGKKPEEFAKSYSSYSEKETKEEIDNKLINFLKEIKENQYVSGLNKTADKLIYNQKYSITTMPANSEHINYQKDEIITKGLETHENRIPDEGKATYTGKAYGAFNQNGELEYSVDFSKRTGEGQITGLHRFKDNIILESGDIQDNRIISSTRTGQAVGVNSDLNRYELKFFGPNAEEIGGKAVFGDHTFGLAGSRGEIIK